MRRAGASLLLVLAVLALGLGALKSGVVPVNADQAPSVVEKRLVSMVLRWSVARAAERTPNASPATAEGLANAAEIYGDLCARCHGDLRKREPSTLGRAFYPPAPPLPGHDTRWSESELRWIIEHGIRNTGMPAWGALLSRDDIRDVAALVKSFSSSGPSS